MQQRNPPQSVTALPKQTRRLLCTMPCNGAEMSVTGDDENDIERIGALSFIGIMVSGMHHQAHHWSMAKGENPHDH